MAVKAAAEGAVVAVHYHRSADGAAADARARSAAAGAEAESFAADIGDGAPGRGARRARSIERFGRVDGLVNNAGLTQVGPFLEIEPAEWDEVIRTDLTAAFHTCRAVLPSMVERGSGTIVNIASRLGQMGVAETAAYSAAKAGLIGLTRALAREFGPRGIRVNAVAPGVTMTEMTDRPRRQRGGPAPAARHAARAVRPRGRGGRLGDLPALRRLEPVPRPDPQPQRRRLHAVSKVIGVREAVGLVRDGSTIVIGGSGAGHALPQRFIDELAAVFTRGGPAARPDDGPRRRDRRLRRSRLLAARAARADAADDRQQHRQRAAPRRARRGERDRVVLVPAGRALAAHARDRGRPARGSSPTSAWARTSTRARPAASRTRATTEDLVEVVTLRGREWLLFHAFPIDVAVIRGTTADEDGNLTMEGEAVQGEMLAMAMAARNSGGIVIAQVRQLATRGSLRMRDVKVPAALIDHVYVDPEQWQTYITQDSPYYAGALRRPVRPEPPLPLDVRKIIARRSLLEFPRGAICNLGFGISQLIGRVAWEEGITDQLVLTVEQGIFGGVPVAGNEGGAGFNYQAMIDQPYMFDFYDGGGLDVASLSFAEVDAEGNVNVHAFEGRVRGPGGFPNISARTPQDQLRRDADRAGPRDRDRRRRPDRPRGRAPASSCRRSARSRSTASWPASAASRSATSPSGPSSPSTTTASC